MPKTPASIPPAEGEMTLHIVFDYTIQKVPTRTTQPVFQQHLDFNVFVKLYPINLDERGYPDPRALWFAERVFIEGWNNKHAPDVKLIQWKSHLKGDPFILSEYRIVMPVRL